MPESPAVSPAVAFHRAGHLEVLADLDGDLRAARRDEVGLVDAVGVGLDPLDRGLRVAGQGRRAHLAGSAPCQQVLVGADALARVEPLASLARAAGRALGCTV